MSDLQPIFLFGAGGHARAAAEVIRRAGRHRIACVLDDRHVGSACGAPIVGGREHLAQLTAQGIGEGFVAVGNNADRELITMFAEAAGLALVTVVDPTAVVASDATIGTGTILMPMSMAGAAVTVGRGVIVNTSATIDHDCTVDDYAHLSPGVHVSGECHIGRRSSVGIGATITGAAHIGPRAIIGAGAAVVSDIPDGVVAAGVPARRISISP